MKCYLQTKDYSVSREEFELRHDENLDMLVTFPQPEDVEKYYESEDYISHTDAKKSLTEKAYQIVKSKNLQHKLRIINRHASTKKSILDVGAGTGDFLNYAKRNSWQISGVEPNEKARKKAAEKGVFLNAGIGELKDRTFDVITLFHVLEHLPNLNHQIFSLNNLLNPGGVLIIAVPNFKSFDAAYYKEHWAAFDVPRHLWHFSQTSISKLFTKHSLYVNKTYPMIFDAFYVSLLSEKYKHKRQGYFAAFCIGLWSNIKAWSSGEYSSLIYVIKRTKQ
ncbi:bifunctional 2-polyprenyl-6-hydroxyphenol methylase/3-demethylubiquinol 3-O-methyltransferase UbiG [Cellulophaga sp. Hel_I_12]|uniref:class I SAM-dependent methyltransferase n=1 Tax=Cellulophaga sp. Hel_I_12 TaxID=1249972 RepID=UPI0006486AE9|nr:class I SAM-dependent methyltransferase [Cellulophaga sp. Hel_I_12]